MTTLTANVVQGNVRDAPAGSKVPLWVRKVLLRGLQPARARSLAVDGGADRGAREGPEHPAPQVGARRPAGCS